MTTTRTRRRLHRTTAIAVTAATLTFGVGSCASPPTTEASYCAILPDSVGLYVDNPITQMGYDIGKVTAITAANNDVRVDFAMSEPRRLPSDVKAIIRSTSILADRSLELVGNYDGGPQLPQGGCVPLSRSATPKSLSEVIGSATNFVEAINPSGSANVGQTLAELDQALHGNGAPVNQLLTKSSAVLGSPDQAIGDMGSIVTNLGQLTGTLNEIQEPLKEILVAAQQTAPQVADALQGGKETFDGVIPLITLVADLEVHLGDATQQTLDTVAVALRKLSPRAPAYASLLNPVPHLINILANSANAKQFSLNYRPPLYRIRTPDGLAQCGIMNASMPGSCADVAGQPYAVDVALLQYVLTQANR
jgi:phospholipid/cholesterol/gamma-HCH transport system substrate-binding protein